MVATIRSFLMKTNNQIRFSPAKRSTAASDRAAAKANNKIEAAYDAVLVENFKKGDEAAFNEIIRRYYARVRAVANQTLHNQADAEEVTQDTFIRAHRGLANFRGDSSLATWLYCIGMNLARNRYWFNFRRHRQDTMSIDRTLVEGSSVSLAGALSDDAATPRAESMTNEFVDLIAKCLAQLDASHREILTMRTMLNLSYDEISSSLGISVGTVKSRIARARENLRERLLQMAPEFGRHWCATDFFEINRPLPSPAFSAA